MLALLTAYGGFSGVRSLQVTGISRLRLLQIAGGPLNPLNPYHLAA